MTIPTFRPLHAKSVNAAAPFTPPSATERTASSQLPPLAPWASGVLAALIEVLDGQRDDQQLRRIVTPRIYAELRERTRREPGPCLPGRLRLCRLHLDQPADGVGEAAARFRCGARDRAVAARFEGLHGRWVVTRLVVG